MYPTILKSRFPGVFTNCFPEQPKLCSPQLQGSSFAYSLSHITEILNSAISLTIMMVKTATQETTSIYKQLQLELSSEEERPLGSSSSGEAEHKMFKGTDTIYGFLV